MKAMTLNMHSMVEEECIALAWPARLQTIVERIAKERYDVIALQEVNQPMDAAAVAAETLKQGGYVPATGEEVIRQGNAAYELTEKLRKKGLEYQWSYAVSHIGYSRYEEGTAMLSLLPVEQACVLSVSKDTELGNWTYRRQVGLRIQLKSGWLWAFSVHFGWWKAETGTSSFLEQWDKMKEGLKGISHEQILLLGDFNNEAHVQGEGYDDIMKDKKWQDLYLQCIEEKEGEALYTVEGQIAGWQGYPAVRKRIDYIFSNEEVAVSSYRTVFDGKNGQVVSDHFGVEAEFQLE